MVKATTVEAGIADTAVDTAKKPSTKRVVKTLLTPQTRLQTLTRLFLTLKTLKQKLKLMLLHKETVVTRTNDERVNSGNRPCNRSR